MNPAGLARKIFWKRACIYVCAVAIAVVFLVLAHVAAAVEIGYLSMLENGEKLADELAQNQALELFLYILAFLIVPTAALAFFTNTALAGSEKKLRLKLNELPTEQRMDGYRVFRRQYLWYLLGCLALGGASIAFAASFQVYWVAVSATSLMLVLAITLLMVAFLPNPHRQKKPPKDEEPKERKELIL